jgi:starch synthase
VGGLGDVVTGLGRSLQKKGHRVEIIIPKYETLDLSSVKNFKVCTNSINPAPVSRF